MLLICHLLLLGHSSEETELRHEAVQIETRADILTQPALISPARPCPLFDDSLKVSQGSH